MKSLTNNLLFCLLRKALWGKEPMPAMQLEQILDVLNEAHKQTIVGLIFNQLTSEPLPEEIIFKQMNRLRIINKANLRMNATMVEMARLLDEAHIQYAIVKGQAIGCLYPHPELRQSGDVDFYCDAKNFERAKKRFEEEWNVSFEKDESDHHIAFTHQGIIFEQHASLAHFLSAKKDAYWQSLLNDTPLTSFSLNDCQISTLSPTLHTIYVFLHLYHHLLELGIGLRQFCDLAVILHACKAEIDANALKQHLSIFGFEKAFRAFGCILVDYLGLPAEDFPYPLKASDKRYSEAILDVVFYRGNMGHYNKKNGFHGFKHNIESSLIKVSHFFKFFPLAPSYNIRWIIYSISRKVFLKLES